MLCRQVLGRGDGVAIYRGSQVDSLEVKSEETQRRRQSNNPIQQKSNGTLVLSISIANVIEPDEQNL